MDYLNEDSNVVIILSLRTKCYSASWVRENLGRLGAFLPAPSDDHCPRLNLLT